MSSRWIWQDKPAINEMVAEVAGKRTAKDCVSKTTKVQKDTRSGAILRA